MFTATPATIIGSSPRVWGTCNLRLNARFWARFIPTGVGNISGSKVVVKSVPVHPHGCGEHILGGTIYLGRLGSSPRVWGTFLHAHTDMTVGRFIPTGVGNIVVAP